MRLIFLFLLLVNLGYAGWYFGLGKEAASSMQVTPAVASVGAGVEVLSLLSEIDPDTYDRMKRRGVATAVAEVEQAKKVCTLIGPFVSKGLQQAFVERVSTLEWQVAISDRSVVSGVEYWVHMEPFVSRDAALAMLRELQSKKIDSYIITQGELKGGISLGLFRSEESAGAVQSELVTLGYETTVRQVPKEKEEKWVLVTSTDIPVEIWRSWEEDFAGIQKQQVICSS